MKKLFVVLLLSVLPNLSFGQLKPRADKFDDFSLSGNSEYFFDDDIPFRERLSRLISHLRSARGKKVYIIHYRGRVTESYWGSERAEQLADRSKWEIHSKTNISDERVVLIDGGIREENSLEFWIAADKAPSPVPMPAFTASEAVVCPSVLLNLQRPAFDPSKPIEISASTSPETKGDVVWHVSTGKIVEEQGSYLKIDALGATRISVTATFPGLPDVCRKSRLLTVDVGPKPYLWDPIVRINESELRGRLDAFFAGLSMDFPSATGFLIAYGSRSRPKSLEAMVRILSNHLMFRDFPRERIVIVKGGYRDNMSVDQWLVPPGAKAPIPTPTVESKFVPTSKGGTKQRR